MWEPMATILRKLVHRKVAAVHHRISTLQCMTLGYLLNVPCLCFAQDELQPRALFPLVLWPRCPLNNSSYMSFWELERDQKHGINFTGRTGNWKVFFHLKVDYLEFLSWREIFPEGTQQLFCSDAGQLYEKQGCQVWVAGWVRLGNSCTLSFLGQGLS